MDDPAGLVLPAPEPGREPMNVPRAADLSPRGIATWIGSSLRAFWTSARPSIPGTKAFERRHQKLIVKYARHRRGDFAALKALTDQEKKAVSRSVRRHLNRLAVLQASENDAAKVATSIATFLIMATLVALPFAVPRWIPIAHQSVWSWIGFTYVYLFGFFLAIVIAAFPVVLLAFARLPKRLVMVVAGVWLIAFGVLAIWAAQDTIARSRETPLGFWDYAILVSLAGASAYVVGLLLMVPPLFAVTLYFRRCRMHHYPVSAVVGDLIGVLSSLERRPAQWKSLEFRRTVLVGLERVARCIEIHVPDRLRHGDDVTNRWSSLAFGRMAAAMRALKRAVVTPMPDSRAYVINVVAASLRHASTGDWDSYPRAELEPLSNAQRISVIGGVARPLLSAIFPLALVEVGNRTGTLGLQPPFDGYVRVGVVVWALIGLLAAFDPTFSAKVTILKDVTDLLPIPGRKKKEE